MTELAADPRLTSGLQDHDLLYASPGASRAFTFLDGGSPYRLDGGADPPPAPDPAGRLRHLVDALRARGADLLYVDLTPPDLAPYSLHAARVIIPDFQPIDFGWRGAASVATASTSCHGRSASPRRGRRRRGSTPTRTRSPDTIPPEPNRSVPLFRDRHPLAWAFHRNTSRWPHNLQSPTDATSPEPPFEEDPHAALSPLPQGRRPTMALAEAVAERFSCRRFADAPLAAAELSTLLGTAYGIRGRVFLGELEFLERPVPSGGGLYPLEVYVLARWVETLEPGVYHYAVLPHAVEQVRSLAMPARFVSELFLGQPYAAEASAVVVLTAVAERSLWKYGDRGYRYVLLEAGHVAQNLNLTAAALGLGCFNLGGFFDDDLSALLGLDADREFPLYGVAVGPPREGDRTTLREPPGAEPV